jgi:hypothetical protein
MEWWNTVKLGFAYMIKLVPESHILIGTNPLDPLFHYSVIPSFQSHDLEALDRLGRSPISANLFCRHSQVTIMQYRIFSSEPSTSPAVKISRRLCGEAPNLNLAIVDCEKKSILSLFFRVPGQVLLPATQ